MSGTNYFVMEMSGDPVQGSDIESTKRKLNRLVSRVDPGVKLEETNFMRMTYRFTWTGLVINIDNIDDVWNAMIKLAGEFLERWEYKIEMNYIETGG